METYKAFFEMVKRWTVKDYKTPGLKAEVIIDMLISEFVEDILAAHLKDKAEQLGIKVPVDVKLLMKEFPIRTSQVDEESKDKRSARVDYLVLVKNTFYLVELKTSNQSLDNNQKRRMQKVMDGHSSAMWRFFFDILHDKSKDKNPRKTRQQAKEEYNHENMLAYFAERQSREQADSKKYFYAFEEMKRRLAGHEDIIDTFTKKDYPIKICYVCLCETHLSQNFFEENDKADCIFLDRVTLLDNSKNKLLWDETVRPILQELRSWAIDFEKEPKSKGEIKGRIN